MFLVELFNSFVIGWPSSDGSSRTDLGGPEKKKRTSTSSQRAGHTIEALRRHGSLEHTKPGETSQRLGGVGWRVRAFILQSLTRRRLDCRRHLAPLPSNRSSTAGLSFGWWRHHVRRTLSGNGLSSGVLSFLLRFLGVPAVPVASHALTH